MAHLTNVLGKTTIVCVAMYVLVEWVWRAHCKATRLIYQGHLQDNAHYWGLSRGPRHRVKLSQRDLNQETK